MAMAYGNYLMYIYGTLHTLYMAMCMLYNAYMALYTLYSVHMAMSPFYNILMAQCTCAEPLYVSQQMPVSTQHMNTVSIWSVHST